MKKIFLLLFVSLMLLNSCKNAEKPAGTFRLLPQPQEFAIDGISGLNSSSIKHYYCEQDIKLPVLGKHLAKAQRSDSPGKAQITMAIDESIMDHDEGYTLKISKREIQVIGKDQAGLFYGLMTLDQLLEDAEEQMVNLPVCTIKDFPALAYRSIQLDMKHHRETLEYYYELMDWLASYKVNGIIAEVEDKIQYERRPLIGSDDAFSIEEWKKLSDYAFERNIEISPLVQGLGHASFILKHDEYRDLRDDPTSDWAFNPLNPETYEVQFDLYLDAIEATPYGKYLHVGGDEVHTTGRGSDKSSLELQLIWLSKVSKFAEEHNRIPIFWDDMPLKHAGVYSAMFNKSLTQDEVDKTWEDNEYKLLEFLDLFPKNCIYMRWNYNSPQALGNAKAMEWFREKGLPVMGATAGQTRWVLMPQNESNMENIRSFAVSSIENDLNGLLLTLWDDDSPHFELYKRGILAFAEYTWAGEKRSKNEIKSAVRHREYSYTLADSVFSFVDLLEKPVAFWKNALLKGNKRNYLAKNENSLDEIIIDLPDKKNKGQWSEKNAYRLEEAMNYNQLCNTIASKIAHMKTEGKRNIYTIEVYEQVNKLVKFTTGALLTLKDYDLADNQASEKEAYEKIKLLAADFDRLRMGFESVYEKTRKLTKPDGYILDQDHHVHLANQSISFDWQFRAEMLFIEKILRDL